MINFKVFKNHSDYEAFVAGDKYVEPHVSYEEDVEGVNYNKKVEPVGHTKITAWCDAEVYGSSKNLLFSIASGEEKFVNLPSDGVLYVKSFGHYLDVIYIDGDSKQSMVYEDWGDGYPVYEFKEIPPESTELGFGYAPV